MLGPDCIPLTSFVMSGENGRHLSLNSHFIKDIGLVKLPVIQFFLI